MATRPAKAQAPSGIDRTVAAIVFDCGTAVSDRCEPAAQVRRRVEALCALGMHAGVDRGTHLDNVDGQDEALEWMQTYGDPDDDKAEGLTRHGVSPELFSGWRVRTLAMHLGVYDPCRGLKRVVEVREDAS